MKELSIVSIVGVCDECEMIDSCIVHLESLRVTILVIDTGSEDGTLDILLRYVEEGRIHLISFGASSGGDIYYLDRAFLYAKERFQPDWVFFQDADEFWCPAAPLQDLLSDLGPCAMLVARYNACVTSDLLGMLASGRSEDIDPTSIDVYVEDLTLRSDLMRVAVPPAWITGRDPGKVLVATDLVASVGKAAHWITGTGNVLLSPDTILSIVVVHIPVSSFQRFKRKVRNADALLLNSLDTFPGETAWHWKRWVELARAGRLREEYDLQLLDPESCRRMQVDGKVRKASLLLSPVQQAASSSHAIG